MAAEAVEADRAEALAEAEKRMRKSSTVQWVTGTESGDLAALRANLAREKAAVEKAAAERRRKQEEDEKASADNRNRARKSVERQMQLRLEMEQATKKYEEGLAGEVLPYILTGFFRQCVVYKQDFHDVGSRSP